MDEHKSIVKQVLQILADNKLLLHLKKCKFHQTKIEYLGVILSQDSVKTNPTKTKGVVITNGHLLFVMGALIL